MAVADANVVYTCAAAYSNGQSTPSYFCRFLNHHGRVVESGFVPEPVDVNLSKELQGRFLSNDHLASCHLFVPMLPATEMEPDLDPKVITGILYKLAT